MSSPGRPPVVPASGNTDGTPPAHEDPPVRMRTAPRAKARRKAAPMAKIGMIVFAIGLVAIFADMILFASGSRDLPLWINLTACRQGR